MTDTITLSRLRLLEQLAVAEENIVLISDHHFDRVVKLINRSKRGWLSWLVCSTHMQCDLNAISMMKKSRLEQIKRIKSAVRQQLHVTITLEDAKFLNYWARSTTVEKLIKQDD